MTAGGGIKNWTRAGLCAGSALSTDKTTGGDARGGDSIAAADVSADEEDYVILGRCGN